MALEPARPRARRRGALVLIGLLLTATASFLFALLYGPTSISAGSLFSAPPGTHEHFIIFSVRMPKAIAAMIVGAALSLAGAVFQALIHNPLASPYVLGVSAGGSLGAVIAIALGFSIHIPAAFAGAVLAIVLVYSIARSRGRVPADTLLLSGVLVNTFLSACILLLTYLTGSDRAMHIMRWLVGGMAEHYEASTLWTSGVLVVALLGCVFCMSRPLNLIALGDETAERLGVALGRTRTMLFFLASMLTAVAVSISGPIGFVGLIVPHMMRLVIGPDHRWLLPSSAIFGAAFLVAADTLAGSMFTLPLPVGLITAFLGGPFFVWLLRLRGFRRSGGGS